MNGKPKAVVAMSGGVDSSVAAYLMKEDGFDVTGIMLKLWKGQAANNESGCCSVDAAEDARRVAQLLDIPFYVFNLADEFDSTVVANFKEQYANGFTPNPCIECNRSIKFRSLLDKTERIGADVLATGHHVRRAGTDGRYRLMRAADRDKDQSYVLYMLGQDELSRTRFPVGEYRKDEIRSIAVSLGFRNANKPESQEICFVPDGDSHAFIAEHLPRASTPGDILDTDGNSLGTHRGYAHYTVGQRRGLGVAAKLPLYVKSIDAGSNTITVADKETIKVTRVLVSGATAVSGALASSFRTEVVTRYRGRPAVASVSASEEGRHVVEFDEPQDPAAPGQAAVFYDGDEVVGGGQIVSAA